MMRKSSHPSSAVREEETRCRSKQAERGDGEESSRSGSMQNEQKEKKKKRLGRDKRKKERREEGSDDTMTSPLRARLCKLGRLPNSSFPQQ